MENKRFIAIGILSITLALLMNFPPSYQVLLDARNVLGIFFSLFFPGYLLLALLFRKELGKMDTLEIFILGIGLSIAVVILSAMILHFLLSSITATNILNLVLAASVALSFVDFFSVKIGRTLSIKDRNFLFLIIMSIAVLGFVIFTSISFSPKEEFVELRWKMSQIENLRGTSSATCAIEGCSLSKTNEIGEVDLAGEKFNILATDMKEFGKYNYFCIDSNRNNIYCEGSEEPFTFNDSFLIKNNGFNAVRMPGNNLMITNYPKETNASSFDVGFVAKSYYKSPVSLDFTLSVNGTAQSTRKITLDSGQEITNYFTVNLPGKGWYRVRIESLPITLERRLYIEFWVKND